MEDEAHRYDFADHLYAKYRCETLVYLIYHLIPLSRVVIICVVCDSQHDTVSCNGEDHEVVENPS